MFYCEKCRKKHKYPESFSMSYGKCELCGALGDCHDVHHSFLPDTYAPNFDYMETNRKRSETKRRLRVRTLNRAKFCDSTKQCNRVCVRSNFEDGTVSRCKHFIAENYDYFGMTFDATRLPVHKRHTRRL